MDKRFGFNRAVIGRYRNDVSNVAAVFACLIHSLNESSTFGSYVGKLNIFSDKLLCKRDDLVISLGKRFFIAGII